jgi:hypothetical protein
LLKVAVNTIKQISKQKPKSSQIKIVERGKLDNPNTQFYTCPLTFLACYVHFDKKKGSRVKLVLWTRISPLSEMMLSCKWFPRASKMCFICFFLNHDIVYSKKC